MLNSSKCQSILQWFNCLTTNINVQSLSQFADGSLFYDIVLSVYSQEEIKSCDTQADEESSANEEQGSTNSAKKPKLRSSKSGQTRKKSTRTILEKQNNYEYIKKFIDDFFKIDSASLISYSDCINDSELELAKVTVLILSAMVFNFLSADNEAVATTTLLDPQVQEDIKDCLSLVLNERKKDNPLKRSEFEKVLARSARYKGTPRRKSQKSLEVAITPETPYNLTKRHRDRIDSEDTQESPLKRLLQSPIAIQHKNAIFMFRKDAEIAKLRNCLDLEEMKVQDLETKMKSLDNELEKKAREIKVLKDDLEKKEEEVEDNIKKLEGVKNLELAQFIATNETLKLSLQNQKEELKSYEVANEELKTKIQELEGRLNQRNSAEYIASNELMVELTKKVEDAENRTVIKEDEVSKLKEYVESLEKYKQMFEEMTAKPTSTPSSPSVQETVEEIITSELPMTAPPKELLVKREEELLSLKEVLQEEVKGKQDAFIAAEKEKSELLQKIETLESNVNILENNLNYYRNQENLDASKAAAEKEKTELTQKIEILTSNVNILEDELNHFRSRETLDASKAAEKEKLDLLQKVEILTSNVNILEDKLNYYRNHENSDVSKAAEKEKSDLLQKIETLNSTVNILEDKLNYYRSREVLASRSKSDSAFNKEVDLSDSQSSEIRSTVTTQTPEQQLGILWKRSCKSSSNKIASPKKSPIRLNESHKYLLTETDLGILKRQSQELLSSLQKGGESQLEKQLNDSVCNITSAKEFLTAFDSILQHVKTKLNPEAPLSTGSSSLRKRRSKLVDIPDMDPTTMMAQIKNLTNDLSRVKTVCKKQLEDKETKLRALEIKYEVLLNSEKALRENSEKLKKEAFDSCKKYECVKKLVEKTKMENKKLLKMYVVLKKSYDEDKASLQSCNDCEKFRSKLSETKEDLCHYKQEQGEMKAIIKSLESKIVNLDRQIKELIKENKRLEFQIQRESAFMSGNALSENSVILRYLNEGLKENERKAKSECTGKKEMQLGQSRGPVMNFNTYILPSEKKDPCAEASFSNNTFANRSIRSDDEEGFLNHSSLAQIHSGVFPEPEPDRFDELKRRNTLCPPHLQSCYPLEIQDMTPSEKKYYDRQSLAVLPSKRPFDSESEQERPEAEFLRMTYNGSQNSSNLVNKKRKVSDKESLASASIRLSSFKKGIKPKTPIRQTGSLSKNQPFKTPSSIRRLIRMPSRKNKQH